MFYNQKLMSFANSLFLLFNEDNSFSEYAYPIIHKGNANLFGLFK